MTIMSSQNQRTNINTAKTSATKLRKVKPSAKKSIAVLLVHWTDLLRASRAACAFFVACDTLPIFARGTRVTWQRTHALDSCVATRRTRRKLSRTTHGESATRRFDVR